VDKVDTFSGPYGANCGIFFLVTRVAVDGTPVPVGTTMSALFYYTNYCDLAWGMDPYKVIPFGIAGHWQLKNTFISCGRW
jgi:hypothetical protein